MSVQKVTSETVQINGLHVKIRVVRDSAICRWLTDNKSIVLGNTIYVSDKLLTQKALVHAMKTFTTRWKVWQFILNIW
jgi:hypothetical protein